MLLIKKKEEEEEEGDGGSRGRWKRRERIALLQKKNYSFNVYGLE